MGSRASRTLRTVIENGEGGNKYSSEVIFLPLPSPSPYIFRERPYPSSVPALPGVAAADTVFAFSCQTVAARPRAAGQPPPPVPRPATESFSRALGDRQGGFRSGSSSG